MPAQRGSGRGQADVDRPATDAALIFDRHFDPVCRYLTRRAGPDAGEELAAETFAQVIGPAVTKWDWDQFSGTIAYSQVGRRSQQAMSSKE